MRSSSSREKEGRMWTLNVRFDGSCRGDSYMRFDDEDNQMKNTPRKAERRLHTRAEWDLPTRRVPPP